jgi:uncharacterized repeat protein (TIGR01451 family)
LGEIKVKTASPPRIAGKIPGKSWLLGLVAATFLFGSLQASATAPSANTVIGNQATAQYVDANNITQSATSNIVQTTVQQVGSLTLTASASASGTPGSTVYIPHVLTNTGNGSDTFTITATSSGSITPRIYLDGGNGKPNGTTPLTFPQTIAGNGGKLQIVVAYDIPTTAGWTGETATVTATAGTTLLYTTPTVTNTDTLGLATGASFSVNKAIAQPAILGPKPWNSPVSSGQVGTKTIYTLTYTNTGLPGSLYIKDQLPSGFTYETGSAAWSSLPSTALSETGAVQGSGSTIEYKYDAANNTIEAFITNVPNSNTGTISFNLTIASGAAVGTTNTTNVAQYNTASCSTTPTNLTTAQAACTSTYLTNTNASAFDVTGTYGVIFGVADPSLGTPATTGDTVTVASATPGSTIYFPQTVTNNGNGTDTINLKDNYAGFTSTFPTGTTFTWLTAGYGTIGDSDGDTNPDVTLAKNTSTTVILAAKLPGSLPVNAAANYTVHPQAISSKDSTKYDLFIATLTAVSPGVVDLTNNPTTSVAGDIGVGPGTTPAYTVSGFTGSTVAIPLTVSNNDTGSLTFTLSASQNTTFPGTLPTGWSVTFNSAQTCSSATTITNVTVGASSSSNLYACVTTTSSVAAVTAQPLYFKAASTAASASTGLVVSDVLFDAVKLDLPAVVSYSFNVTPSNTGTVAPGNVVVFPHTITNVGTQSCFAGTGTTNFRVTVTGLPSTWNAAVYLDTNNSGTYDVNTDTQVVGTGTGGVYEGTTSSLAAAGSFKILVRVFAPAGASAGDQSVITVKVDDLNTTNACTLSGNSPTDTATVVSGQVSVVKTQAADTACTGTVSSFSANAISLKPGQCVVYQVVATNNSQSPISNLTIADAIPQHTNYAGATQPSNACTSSTGAGVSYSSSTNGVSCGGSNYVLPPQGTVTLKFAVQVDQ